MKERAKEIIYFSILILFLVLLSLTVVSFYFIDQNNSPIIISIFVKYHVFFMFLNAILGLLFGSLSYVFLNRKIDKKNKDMNETIKVLLSLLNFEEKNIINFLLKNQGNSTQYELSKIEGMTKLKVHRGLEKLEQKTVITKQKLGKINKIYLSDKLKF